MTRIVTPNDIYSKLYKPDICSYLENDLINYAGRGLNISIMDVISYLNSLEVNIDILKTRDFNFNYDLESEFILVYTPMDGLDYGLILREFDKFLQSVRFFESFPVLMDIENVKNKLYHEFIDLESTNDAGFEHCAMFVFQTHPHETDINNDSKYYFTGVYVGVPFEVFGIKNNKRR